MNKKMIVYILGKMMGVEGLLLLIPALVSLIYHEKSVISFLIVAAVLLVIYMVFGRKLPASKQIYGKEGFVIVGLAWILWSAFGALPFVISGSIPYYIDALFDTISGFTTTGSTILADIEALPMGISFWRSFTHWIGGMGVLVFVMMITSLDDENAMPLMRAEVPGPEADKLVPKARHTARLLYGMYFVLTAAEVVFLLFGGMNLYDALLHAFSTAGTGGFSNRAASVSFYDSAYIDGVITVFMILFGMLAVNIVFSAAQVKCTSKYSTGRANILRWVTIVFVMLTVWQIGVGCTKPYDRCDSLVADHTYALLIFMLLRAMIIPRKTESEIACDFAPEEDVNIWNMKDSIDTLEVDTQSLNEKTDLLINYIRMLEIRIRKLEIECNQEKSSVNKESAEEEIKAIEELLHKSEEAGRPTEYQQFRAKAKDINDRRRKKFREVMGIEEDEKY